MRNKYIPYEELKAAISAIRQKANIKLVLTNGCFDIFHAGHAYSLAYARSLGDILLVLINDDEAVRQLKGADRPYYPLQSRIFTVGSLEAVSLVAPLPATDLIEALTLVKPDVWVKGQDYTLQTLNQTERSVAESLNVQIEFAPLLSGVSTSNIIDVIRTQAVVDYQKNRMVAGNFSKDVLPKAQHYEQPRPGTIKDIPPELQRQLQRLATDELVAQSAAAVNTQALYNINDPGEKMIPPLNCIHRQEKISINKHCACKSKTLFCNLFQKKIRLRDCMDCKSRQEN